MTREYSTTEPKIIILEGVDRVGKSTLKDTIHKLTNFKHFLIDRGPISYMAYCEIFNRPIDLYLKYSDMEKRLAKMPNVLVFYLTANNETLIDRCIADNHEIIDFDFHKQVFERIIKTSPLKSITIDTSNNSPESIVTDLIKEGVL